MESTIQNDINLTYLITVYLLMQSYSVHSKIQTFIPLLCAHCHSALCGSFLGPVVCCAHDRLSFIYLWYLDEHIELMPVDKSWAYKYLFRPTEIKASQILVESFGFYTNGINTSS